MNISVFSGNNTVVSSPFIYNIKVKTKCSSNEGIMQSRFEDN